jgi:hypothetical protein
VCYQHLLHQKIEICDAFLGFLEVFRDFWQFLDNSHFLREFSDCLSVTFALERLSTNTIRPSKPPQLTKASLGSQTD